MLPHPWQVGEAQIDHLHLLILDCLQKIFGCRTIRKHRFTPVVETRAWNVIWPTLHAIPPQQQPRSGMPRSSRGNSVTPEPVASTLVRPAHEFHGVFDM